MGRDNCVRSLSLLATFLLEPSVKSKEGLGRRDMVNRLLWNLLLASQLDDRIEYSLTLASGDGQQIEAQFFSFPVISIVNFNGLNSTLPLSAPQVLPIFTGWGGARPAFCNSGQPFPPWGEVFKLLFLLETN